MSSHRIAFCFSLLLLFLASGVSASEVKELILDGYWKKLFEEENNSPVPVTYTRKCTTGLKTLMTDENTVTVSHTAGINAKNDLSLGVKLEVGDIMRVLSIGISYEYKHETTSKTVRGSEVHRSTEQTVMFTVPGWTRLVRWQLVVDVAGVDYEYDHTLTVTNSTAMPKTISAKATVELRRRIHFGRTPIRIKHKDKKQYMIVVTRKGWPAATLGISNLFHYILYDIEGRGIRIKTLNTTSYGYHYLYSSDQGGLYFDEDANEGNHFNSKQYWYLSKSAPLHDRDVVTFRNKNFDDSYICRYTEGSRDVNLYCIQNREEEFILEVV